MSLSTRRHEHCKVVLRRYNYKMYANKSFGVAKKHGGEIVMNQKCKDNPTVTGVGRVVG